MGNYKNIEHDFVDRTVKLLSQYESIMHKYPFPDQFNYTLLINCLLGVIVMPNEKVFSHIPNHRISNQLKQDMGLIETKIHPRYTYLRTFIEALRHSIAHFSIDIISNDDNELIDRIVFKESEDYGGEVIVNFSSKELLPFIRYYASWLQHMLIEHR